MTAAVDPVGAHLAELGRALRGPARLRRGLLREARDGLEDAAAAYRDAGHGRSRAAELAVRDFGPVVHVAAAFQDELTAGQGRRTALLLAVAFPAMLIGWDVLLAGGQDWSAGTPPAMHALPVVQTAAGWGVAVAALALLGLPPHRTGSPRRVGSAVAVAAVVGVLVCGGAGVGMNLTGGSRSWHWAATSPAAIGLYAASLLALVLVARSTVRTVRVLRAPVPC